jgi:hypothetical protein
MSNGHAAPAMQLVADERGIRCLIKDQHGATVTLQQGRVSVAVETPEIED